MVTRPSRGERPGQRRSIWISAGIGALVGISIAAGVGLSLGGGDSTPPLTSTVTLATVAKHSVNAVVVERTPHVRTAPSATAPKPPIVWKGIRFNDARRQQMVDYSRLHYGAKLADWRLTDPKVIVEHYTASDTFSSAWNTFEGNSADSEFNQLPGVCAHFIIDRDGTIYQLVRLNTRCRHVVGLNHRAVGIEMVGNSDSDILTNPPQLHSALALTRWLQSRFGIATKNVIGHSESLSSPYYLELFGPMKGQTHGDWTAANMRTFRTRLRAG